MSQRGVRLAGVIGAGTMGAGITMAFTNAGIDVRMVDASTPALDRARATMESIYGAQVARGRLSRDDADGRLRRVSRAASIDELSDVDVAIEAVFEDLSVKRSIFERLGERCAPTALLATNTSTLDVDRIGEAASHPERTLGMHFFSPAHVMKLVEIVRGSHTSQAALDSALALTNALGKIPVVVGNCDGFVGNRMLLAYRREAEFLVLAGASPARVDAALEAFGFAMGPFAVADLAGIDVGWRSKHERIKRGAPPPFSVSNLPDAMVAAERFGQKSGRGYYRYEPGSRARTPDPEVDTILARERQIAGATARDIDDGEIVERCIYALVNEGGHILDDGIAASAGDIDTIWVSGYGFPKERGGPMRYAEDVGPALVLERVREFARDDPAFWRTSRSLARAAQTRTFAAAGNA